MGNSRTSERDLLTGASYLQRMAEEIDLRKAMNAVSDVIQNRPRPLREFDQIYMKAGDMVMQSEFIARWGNGKRLAFIGDGDAISVCVAYLRARSVLPYGPASVTVFDFDERIVNAITRRDTTEEEIAAREAVACSAYGMVFGRVAELTAVDSDDPEEKT